VNDNNTIVVMINKVFCYSQFLLIGKTNSVLLLSARLLCG